MNKFNEFKEKLKEADEIKPLILENVSIQTFEIVSQWMYSDRLDIELVETIMQEWQSDQEHSQKVRLLIQFHEASSCLLDVYLFGTFYQSRELRNMTVIHLQRLMNKINFVLQIKTIKRMTDQLSLTVPICRLLINSLANPRGTDAEKSKADINTLSRGFLTELFCIGRKRDDGVTTWKGWIADWCEYHEHEDDEERKSCHASRPNDYDVKNKTLIGARAREKMRQKQLAQEKLVKKS